MIDTYNKTNAILFPLPLFEHNHNRSSTLAFPLLKSHLNKKKKKTPSLSLSLPLFSTALTNMLWIQGHFLDTREWVSRDLLLCSEWINQSLTEVHDLHVAAHTGLHLPEAETSLRLLCICMFEITSLPLQLMNGSSAAHPKKHSLTTWT